MLETQVGTWFGIFTLNENEIIDVELFPKDTIIKHLLDKPLLFTGNINGEDIRNLALEYGFVSSYNEYDKILHDTNIQFIKAQLSMAITHDREIIAAVEAIDNVDETINILSERLKEWYLLNNETQLYGDRLINYILDLNGLDSDTELKTMKSLASNILGLYETRVNIEEYIKINIKKLAPNMTNIAGYSLAAHLLSISGSLERLASMPSSTIQVLGANNSLFKHLKGKAPSPKHGIIFRHPYINTSPKHLRGKIARTLASKISIAAKCDFYSCELKEGLFEELEKKVMAIKKSDNKKY